MKSVAVNTDRFIRRLVGILFGKQLDICPMKISNIRIQNIRGNSVLIHDGRVCVAFRAQEGNAVPESIRGRVGNIMYAMAVNTGWNVGIKFLDQCIPVHARFVLFEDFSVALGANLGYVDPCPVREFAARFAC